MINEIYYVWGVTCTGKSYFTQRALHYAEHRIGVVDVGKEFRRRHPPEYFTGMGAMPHTEEEALAIFEEQVAACRKEEKKTILVSGQPRLMTQLNHTVGTYGGKIIWLHCSQETMDKRLRERFPTDRSSHELGVKRMLNDRIQLFDVMFHCVKEHGIDVIYVNTDYDDVDVVIENLF